MAKKVISILVGAGAAGLGLWCAFLFVESRGETEAAKPTIERPEVEEAVANEPVHPMRASPIDLYSLEFTGEILRQFSIGESEAKELGEFFRSMVQEVAELDRKHLKSISHIEGDFAFDIPAYPEAETDLELKFRSGVEKILGQPLAEEFLSDAGLQFALRKWFGSFGKVNRVVAIENINNDRSSSNKVRVSGRCFQDREFMYRYSELPLEEQLKLDRYPELRFEITRDRLPAAFAHLVTLAAEKGL